VASASGSRLFLRILVIVRILPNRLRRHAIAAVHPPGKILKLAPLAAERNPGRLCGLAATKDADTRRHKTTFYCSCQRLKASGYRRDCYQPQD